MFTNLCVNTSHLNGLAPEGLMGVCIPEVDLLVLRAGNKLLHGGMDVQTPQLIRVTLKHAYSLIYLTITLCVRVCIYTCTIGVKVSGNVARRIAFLVVPMKSSPGFPSAKVRTGPNDSPTCTHTNIQLTNNIQMFLSWLSDPEVNAFTSMSLCFL